MNVKNIVKSLSLSGLMVLIVVSSGCAMGNSRESVYERAKFAARAKIDLEKTAFETNQVLSRYQSVYATNQYSELENEFTNASVVLANASKSPKMSTERMANLITQTYRQYGEQRGRLERELLQDKAKADLLVAKIVQGGENLEALEMSEEIEASAEADLNQFMGDLILKSGATLVYEAQSIAAQKKANDLLEERIKLLSAPPAEEHHVEPEPEVVVPTGTGE